MRSIIFAYFEDDARSATTSWILNDYIFSRFFVLWVSVGNHIGSFTSVYRLRMYASWSRPGEIGIYIYTYHQHLVSSATNTIGIISYHRVEFSPQPYIGSWFSLVHSRREPRCCVGVNAVMAVANFLPPTVWQAPAAERNPGCVSL